jgi:hypothetical protein
MTPLRYSFTCSCVCVCCDPLILNLDTREECVITFMHRPPPPQERSPSTHSILVFVDTRNSLVELEERKISYPCRELYPLVHGREPLGLVAYRIYCISHKKSSNKTCT